MPDPVALLRSSADRLDAVLAPLSESQVTAPSYDDDWTIADVASHLGSGAEIFDAYVAAGVAGDEPPGNDAAPPIWDRWNATPPAEQVSNSRTTNEAFVSRLEGLSAEQREAFSVPMFGMQADLGVLAGMRLGEVTLHTWDIAVMADPELRLPEEAVAPMVASFGPLIGRAIKPVADGGTVAVETTAPDGRYVFDLAAGEQVADDAATDAVVTMPAEAFLRLVAGRLDPDHTAAAVVPDADVLDRLRQAFPGF